MKASLSFQQHQSKSRFASFTLLIALALFSLIPSGVKAQQTVTIGDGSSTTWYPLPGLYGWQYTVYLYKPSDDATLNSPMLITSLAFNASSAVTTSGAQMQMYIKDVDPSMELSSSSTFSSYTSGATLVYSNSAFTNTSGWNDFQFSTPFNHQGGRAILVALRSVGCSTSGGCSRYVYYTTSSNRCWTKYADSSDPGTSVSASSLNSYLANARFTYTPACTQITSPADGATVNSSSTTVTWSEWSSATSYHVYVSTTPEKPATYTYNTTSTSQVVSDLRYGTNHIWVVPCEAGGERDCDSHISIVRSCPATITAPTISANTDLNNLSCGQTITLTANTEFANVFWYADASCTQLLGEGPTYSFQASDHPITVYCTAGCVTTPASSGVQNFSYTGGQQTYTVPSGVTSVQLEVWGAQGGYRSTSTYGGMGGYSIGTASVTPGQTLYVNVGGSGNTGGTSGGYNGGGSRTSYAGGGGATHIATRSGVLSSLSSYQSTVLIVAGGGGSCGASTKNGMYGGGTSGGSATQSYGSGGGGGTQSAGGTGGNGNSGSFGQGGAGLYRSSGYGGAGGGGWYGGGGAYPDGSGDDDRGGGGGSGYIGGVSNGNTIAGNASMPSTSGGTETGHAGNGYARITYTIPEVWSYSSPASITSGVAFTPATPVVDVATACPGEAVVLTVTNAMEGVTYGWWNNAACTGVPLHEGVSYTIQDIQSSGNYYVRAYAGTMTPVFEFPYTGTEQTLSVPAGVESVTMEVWGAQGGGSQVDGNSSLGVGGLGGYSIGTMSFSNATTLYISVGGQGGTSSSAAAPGGWNGGGTSFASSSSDPAGGGGGATHIATASGLLKNLSGNQSSVLIVAGGGGEDSEQGGYGGGTTGGTGSSSGATGGTQSAGGTGGVFGSGASTQYDGGAGGGGWYGGGTNGGSQTIPTSNSTSDCNGGCGGSGYVNPNLTSAQTIGGNTSFAAPNGGNETGHAGNGYARVTLNGYTPSCMSDICTVPVTLYPAPSFTLTSSASSSCHHSPVTLTINNPSSDIIRYEWDDGTITTETSRTVIPEQTTTYRVTASNEGCHTIAEVEILVDAPSVSFLYDDNDECITTGTEVTLSVVSGNGNGNNGCSGSVDMSSTTTVLTPGCSLSFYDHNGSSSNYSDNEDYTQTFTSADGGPVTIVFTSVGAESCCDYMYLYDGPNTSGTSLYGALLYNLPTNTVYTASSGSLTVHFTSDVSNNGLGWVATVTSIPLCTYTWSNGASESSITVSPTETTTYSVTIAGPSYTCDVNFEHTVRITPVVAITPESPIICPNTTVNITASGAENFSWSNYANTANITVGAGSYTVTASNADGCSATGSVVVTALSEPFAGEIDNMTVCQSDFVITLASTTPAVGGGLVEYSWTINDIITTDWSESPEYTLTDAQRTALGTGTFTMTRSFRDDCGNVGSVSANLTINPPMAQPTIVGNTNLFCGQSTTLTASTSVQGNIRYRWFSDPNGQNLVYEGSEFTTPVLDATTTYYVQSIDVPVGGAPTDFEYTGTVQTYEIPGGVTKVQLEVWGAQGGNLTNSSYNWFGGNGGYASGTLSVSAGDVLNVYVGGRGADGQSNTAGSADGGWNGGGNSGTSQGSSSSIFYGGGGGGASDVRINSTSPYARVLVAGGGGGAGYGAQTTNTVAGGYGGGTQGTDGICQTSGRSGYGGTATAAGNGGVNGSLVAGVQGSFGLGAASSTSASYSTGGGGGGGWYGGGSGSEGNGWAGSGGGGSGYVYESSTASVYPSGCLLNSAYYLENAQTIAGNTSFTAPDGTAETGHSGNGFARITILEMEYSTSNCPSELLPVTINVETAPAPQVEVRSACIGEPSELAVLDPIEEYHYQWSSTPDFSDILATGNTFTPTVTTPTTYYVRSVAGSSTQSIDFEYTGDEQVYTIPVGVNHVQLEVWGAQGGDGNDYSSQGNPHNGGNGGYSVGTLNVSQGQVLYIYVGQEGLHNAGSSTAWNGGGAQGVSSYEAGTGGGATDIRIGGNSLYNRLIVAGGGGGGGNNSIGGQGGGSNGIQPSSDTQFSSRAAGAGGGQTTGYEFGVGQGLNGENLNGGGGGGWYGGAQGDNSTGGGGGSGYVYTSATASSYPSGCLLNSSYYLTNAQTIAGNESFPAPGGGTEIGHTGNGLARITLLDMADDYCASQTSTVTLTPQPAPTFTLTSSSNTYCSGDDAVVFTINDPSSDIIGYEWSDGTNTTEPTHTVTPGYTTTYIVTVSNTYCSVVSQEITIGVDAPEVAVSASDNGECVEPGTEVTINLDINSGTSGQFNANDYTFTRTTGTYTHLSNPTYIYSNTTADGLSGTINFPSGFVFPFCGTDYNTVYVYDGQLRFGSSSQSYSTSDMLASTSYYNIVAPFLSDLYVSTNGSVGWQMVEENGTRAIVVQFRDVTTYSDNGESTTRNFNFQAKLFENGDIQFCYGSGFSNINAFFSSAYTCIGINSANAHYIQVTPTSGGATAQTSGTLTALTTTDAHYITSGTIYNFRYPTQANIAWSTGATERTIRVSPTETTTYTVTVTDEDHVCPAILDYTVRVNPVVSVTPENPMVCAGGNVTLTASGAENYSWSTGATTSSIVATAGTYTVTGSDSDGCSRSVNVTVSSLSTPSAGAIADNTVACLSDLDITIASTTPATGGGIVEYRWIIGSITTDWSENPSYTLTDADRDALGANNYTVTREYRDACGNSGSTTGDLALNPPMPQPTVTGVTDILCGQSTTLTATSTYNSDHITYRWYSDPEGRNLVYEGNEFTTPSLDANTTYYLQISSEYMLPGDPINYSTSGSYTYNVPADATSLQLQVWGAEGGGQRISGNTAAGYGGHGGYSVGIMPIMGGETLHVYVGGVGGYANAGLAAGGFNGGGSTYGSSDSEPAGGGGGATDIRLNGTTLYDRIIVAGGGGGGGEDASDQGGFGGGESGGGGNAYSYQGTQTSAGTGAVFGIGASAGNDGGAGGGGWYGGGTYGGSQSTPTSSSGSDCNGGSGGSGYVWTAATSASAPTGYNVPEAYYLTDAQTIAGNLSFPAPNGGNETGHQGNGYARITPYYHRVDGCPSVLMPVTISVTTAPAPVVEIVSACIGQPSELVVVNPVEGFQYQWSTTPDFSVIEATGNTFTPTVSTPTDYYVRSVVGNETEIINFEYTGSVQNFTVPAGVSRVQLEVWGAQGGQTTYSSYVWLGGHGGYASGILNVTPGTQLSVYVGGQGGAGTTGTTGTAAGGWNGGGASGTSSTSSYFYGGGGGGATDIRVNGTSLSNRVIVAGGGGGAGYGETTTNTIAGGVGGGLNGERPSYTSSSYENRKGSGGTQTAGGAAGTYSSDGTAGSLGTGGTGGSGAAGGAGGGAGYYGGGGGNYGSSMAGGGGGGSAYIGGVTDGVTIAGNSSFLAPDGVAETGHTGNGYARVTLLDMASDYCPSETAMVSLNPQPAPEFTFSSSSATYCFGENPVDLTVVLDPSSPAVSSYIWSDGVTTTEPTHEVTPGHTTTYTVTVSTGLCGVESQAITIGVDAPEVTFIASDNGECVDLGTEVTLGIGSAGAECPASVNMSTGTMLLSSNCSFNYYDHNGPSGAYENYEDFTQTFTSADGSPVTIVFSSVDGESCCDYIYLYDGASTSGTSLYGSYLYSVPTNTAYTANSGSLTIHFTSDVSNTGAGWQAVISVESPYNYLWSNGSTDNAITVSPTETTTYIVTVTDAAHVCPAILDYTVRVKPAVTLTSDPESLCNPDDPAVLTVSGSDSYLWNDMTTTSATLNVQGEGTYSVTATSNDGCVSVLSYDLVAPVYNAGAIRSSGNAVPVCQSETAPLTIASTDDGLSGGIIQYRWSLDGSLISNTNNPSYTVSATELQSLELGLHTYTREVLNDCTGEWFASSGSYTINILGSFPEPEVRGYENYVVCGTNGKLYVAHHDDEITNYWYEDAECTILYAVGDTVTVPNMTENKTLWHVALNQTLVPIAQEFGVVGQHEFVVPDGVTEVQLEVWGAEGGYRSSATYAGKGGYSVGTAPVTPGQTLYVNVGGSGNSGTLSGSVYAGGYNGGGYRYQYHGGGGATHVATASGQLKTLSNNRSSVLIVAGGGGSDGATNKHGMYGGGLEGGATTESYGSYGYGGTQTGFTTSTTPLTTQVTSNSSSYAGGFGFGGFGYYSDSGYAGAGGGGWYGGCGSNPDSSGDDDRGGGGGSGYLSPALTDALTVAGNQYFPAPTGGTEYGHSGNGYARITGLGRIVISPCPSIPVPYTLQLAEPSAPVVSDVTTHCSLPATLQVQDAHEELTYLWSTQPDFSDTAGFGSSFELTEEPGDYTFYVKSYTGSEEGTIVYLLNEGFESPSMPSGWRAIDADGDGYNWRHVSTVEDFGDPTPYVHSGSGFYLSQSYDATEGEALEPDNWLITPAMQIPANREVNLSWWARAQDPDYAEEYYEVRVSTTGYTASSFTNLLYSGLPTDSYVQHTYDLSAYAGQTIYVAFRHTNTYDMFYLDLDDIQVSYEIPPVLYCESPSTTATIHVLDVPEITFENATPQITCGTGTTLTVSNPIDGYTYEWFADAACTQSIGFGTSINVANITSDSTFYVKSYLPVGGQDVINFGFTGAEQTFTVPAGITELTLEVWGAQGGQGGPTNMGGRGGYSTGTITVEPGDVLYVNVGGEGEGSTETTMGGTCAGGYNGGGIGYSNNNGVRGGGGGATHIATASGLLQNLSSNQSAVLIVAGGGGGNMYFSANEYISGTGGGLSGTNGSNSSYGFGGTQTEGGAGYSSFEPAGFGYGGYYGPNSSGTICGGGAGWYGGGSGNPGGGGSGYIGGVTNGTTTNGTLSFLAPDGTTETGHPGNGYARISYDIPVGTTCESPVGSVTVTLNDIIAPDVYMPAHITCGTYLSLAVTNPMDGFKYIWYSDAECHNKVHEGTSWELSGLSNTTDTTYYVKACKEAVGSGREDTVSFLYTGSEQTYTIPAGVVSLTLQTWGAQGGSYSSSSQGGRGGYTEGVLTNLEGLSTLSVCVGGQGTTTAAGYNGGAASNGFGAGGGATHIATLPGTLNTLINDRDAVLVVAGGGGGSGTRANDNGGYGGGLQAGRGAAGSSGEDPVNGGAGASTMNGSDNLFGANTTTATAGGGGGGGWYAGENGDAPNTKPGGGGGSGYISTMLANGSTTAGNFQFNDINGNSEFGHFGDGAARIIAKYPAIYTCESEVVPVRITHDQIESLYDIFVITPVADAYEMCEGETVQLYAHAEPAEGDDEIPSIIWYRGNGNGDSVYINYSASDEIIEVTEPAAGEWFYYAYAATDIISASGEYALNTLTEYDLDRTSSGNFYFDVATPIEIQLHGIDIYPTRTQGDDVTVYFATRSGEGLLATPSAWTSLGTYHVDYNSTQPSTIELNDTITIPAGQTYSFYMKSNNGIYLNNINGLRRIGFDAITGVEVYAGEGTAELNAFPPQTHSPRQFKGAIRYALTGETRFGCIAQDAAETSVIVDIPSGPADSISIEDDRFIVCVGQDPITLTAHNAFLGDNVEYMWVKETRGVYTELGSSYDPDITVDVPDTTSRYGVFLHSTYCGNTDTLFTKIIVAIDPTVADITPDTICAFSSLNLEAPELSVAGDLDIDGYRWEISEDSVDFVPFTANENEEIGLSYNGWYIRYAATSECATGYSNTVQITVDTAAYFDELATPQPICAGNTFDWAANTAEVHYVNNSGREIRTGWNLYAGGSLVEPFVEDYVFYYNSDTNYYQYNCYIVTACDSVVSNLATITVWDIPDVGAIEGVGATCAGLPVTLDAPVVTPYGPVDTVGWEYADAIGSIYFTRLPADFIIDYTMNGKVIRYFAENRCGSHESNSVQIIIIDRPYVGDIDALDTLCSGTLFDMTEPAVTDNGGIDEYTTGWYLSENEEVAEGETVTEVHIGDPMFYDSWNGKWLHFGITNDCGVRYSNGVKVNLRSDHHINITVERQPYGPVTESEVVTDESCFGPDYLLTASSDLSGTSFVWTATTGANLASTTGASVLSQQPEAGLQRYIATVTESTYGCSASDTVMLRIVLIHTDTSVTVCQSDLPFVYDPVGKPNETFDRSGRYQLVYQTEAGCDSIINLELNVHYPIVRRTTLHLCNNSPYPWRGTVYGGMGVADTLITTGDTIVSNSWRSDMHWDANEQAWVLGDYCDSILYLLELNVSNEPYLDIPQDEFTLPVGETVTAEANVRKDCELCVAKSAVVYQLYKDDVPVDNVRDYGELTINTYLPDLNHTFGNTLISGYGEIPGNTFTINNYNYDYFHAQFFGEIDNNITATWNQPGEYKLQMVIIRKATDSGQDFPMTYRYEEDNPALGVNGYANTPMGGANSLSTDSIFTDTAYIYFHVGTVTDVVVDTAVCADAYPFTYHATNIEGEGRYEISTGNEGVFTRYFLNVTTIQIDTTVLTVNTTEASYELDNNIYEAGSYTVTLVASTGCDSIIMLTVNTGAAENSDTVHVTACHDYTWDVTGATYDVDGIYTDGEHNLDLTVLDAPYAEATIYVSSLQFPYTYQGTEYNDFGTYRLTYPYDGGDCDSIVDLHIVEATAGIDIDTVSFAAEVGEENSFDITILGGELGDLKVGLDYVVTRNGVVIDDITDYGSIYFSTEYPDIHRTFGNSITTGTGSVPTNTFAVLYYHFDYFYMRFFNGIHNSMTATWNVPGEYQVTFYLRNREGGNDIPLTSRNLPIGGHGSTAASLIAVDSVIMHYVGDTVYTQAAEQICASQIGETVVYNYHGFEFTETTGGLNVYSPYSEDTTFVAYTTNFEEARTIENHELFIYDPYRIHDTIVDFSLTINTEYTVDYSVNLCAGSSYEDQNFTLTARQIAQRNVDGVATFVLNGRTEAGCDSVVTLSINVIPNPTLRIAVNTLICEGMDVPVVTTVTSPINYNNDIEMNLPMNNVLRDTNANGVETIRIIDTIYDMSESTVIYATTTNRLDDEVICMTTDTVRITVYPIDTIAAPITAEVCQGESYQLVDPSWDNSFNITSQRTMNAIDPNNRVPVVIYDTIVTGHNSCGRYYAVLALTVNPVFGVQTPPVIIYDNVCESYDYEGYGYELTVDSIETVAEEATTTYLEFRHEDISSHGCDSVTVLRLTILPTTYGQATVNVCESSLPYEYTFDATQSATITTDTVVNFLMKNASATGCDTIVAMNFVIDPMPVFEVEGETAICNNGELSLAVNFAADSIKWYIGGELYAEGPDMSVVSDANTNLPTEVEVFVYDATCVATETVNITLLPTYEVRDTMTICDNDFPYEWNGITFNEVGEQTAHLYTGNGCDSIVIMTVFANPTYNITVEETVNASDLPYTYLTATFEEGTPAHSTTEFHLYSIDGCDSIVTLNLTVVYETGTDPFMTVENTSDNSATLTVFANEMPLDSKVSVNYHLYKNNNLVEDVELECGGDFFIGTEFQGNYYGMDLTVAEGNVPENTFHITNNYYEYFYFAFLNGRENTVTHNFTENGSYDIVFELVSETGGQDFPYPYDNDFTHRIGGKNSTEGSTVLATATVHFNVTGEGEQEEQVNNPPVIRLSRPSVSTAQSEVIVYFTNPGSYNTAQVALNYSVYRNNDSEPMSMLANVGTIHFSTEFNGTQYGEDLTEGTGSIPQATFHPMPSYMYEYFYGSFMFAPTTIHRINAQWTTPGTYRVVFDLMKMENGQDFPLMYNGQRIGGKNADEVVRLATTTLTYNITNVGQNPAISGIDGNDDVEGFGLYPNPANDHAVLTLGKVSDNAVIVITDVNGKEVYRNAATDNRIEFSVATWSEGVYFVTLRDDDQIVTKKLVVTK